MEGTTKEREPLKSTAEYERDVIGCAIRDQYCAQRLITETLPQHYRDPFHRAVMVEAVKQYGIDQVFDPLRIAKAIEDRFKSDTFNPIYYLCELGSTDNLPTVACFDSRLGEVIRASRKQQLFAISDAAAEASLNGKDPGEILRVLKAEIEDYERDNSSTIDLRKASSYEHRIVDWSWQQWLHRGGFTLLDGDPEKGKSQITCAVAACWTAPKPFPLTTHDHFREPGNALFIALEDGIETTTRPRLEAAGANLDRVYIWPEDAEPIRFPSGIDTLADAVKRFDISLLVLDPISAYLDESVNANSDSDVRRALRPLVALAQETNLAVIGVRHLNKDANKSPLYRGGGSIAFTAQARVVWAAAIDPNDTNKMVLAVLKSNIGKKPASLSYSIESVGSTSRVKWEGESMLTANDIFGQKHQRGGKTADAKALLQELLANGARPEREVWDACEAAGIGEWPYKQARKQLHIESSKGSMREGWLLSLPEEGGFDEGEGNAPDTK